MGVLIDASILIDAERGRINVAEKIKSHQNEEFFVSVITASELWHGVYRAKDSAIHSQRSAFVEGIMDRFPILPIDLNIARIHAQIWAEAATKGKLIGPHDLWLAASCIAYGYTLITGNIKEFKKIPGLQVESWV